MEWYRKIKGGIRDEKTEILAGQWTRDATSRDVFIVTGSLHMHLKYMTASRYSMDNKEIKMNARGWKWQ